MKRNATAIWKGDGKTGNGRLTTDSKVLEGTAYAFNTRFENEKGTNPEELVAAAHAGCFAMQLSFNVIEAGGKTNELDTKCQVTFKDGAITSSNITLEADIDGLDKDEIEKVIRDAEKNCPISKLLNTEIKVEYSVK